MKKRYILAASALSLLLIGCGGSEDSTPTAELPDSSSFSTYSLKLVDDAIVGAKVFAPECSGYEDKGNGHYELTGCYMKPTSIQSLGGFIDLNGNGDIDAEDTAQSAPLKLRISQTSLEDGFVVSPLTTLASSENADLDALARALGLESTEELFNETNTELQQAVNLLLISACDAGIVKYDSFIEELQTLVESSTTSGADALKEVQQRFVTNQDEYVNKFGIAFGGFILDTTALDLDNTTDSFATLNLNTSVTDGKIKLTGFVYDMAIADATVTIYDGEDIVGTATSDALGRYSTEIDESILNESKVLKLEAVAGQTKLVSYITTDEIKDGLIGQRLLSAQEVALIISNVTTAKAVLIKKTDPEALNDPLKLEQSKVIIESMYTQQLLELSSAIQDVVDQNKSITQSDTLSFAEELVDAATVSPLVNVSVPENIDINTTAIVEDPMLSAQLNNSESPAISEESFRALFEDKKLYSFDWHWEYDYHLTYDEDIFYSSGINEWKEYKLEDGEWVVDFEEVLDFSDSAQWSADNNTLYVAGPVEASKLELISTENITISGFPVTIYHIRMETIGEPTQEYYDRFVELAHNEGTFEYDASTMKVTKIHIDYEDGSYSEYTLRDDGTYVRDNSDEAYPYTVEEHYGKTYVILKMTNDGDGRIFYVDYETGKAYKRDYNPVGSVEEWIEYESVSLLTLWKNLSDDQIAELQEKIEDATNDVTFTEDYTHYMAVQSTIYQYIKSFAD